MFLSYSRSCGKKDEHTHPRRLCKGVDQLVFPQSEGEACMEDAYWSVTSLLTHQWWSKLEGVQQLHTMFGDVPAFLHGSDLPLATKSKLLRILMMTLHVES